MRSIILFLFLSFGFHNLMAQTITTSEEKVADTKQKLVNKYSCFFRTMEDQKRLFRVGLTSLSRGYGFFNSSYKTNLNGLELGVEQKIRTGFSVSYASAIQYFRFNNFLEHPEFNFPRIGVNDMVSYRNAIELRLYLGKGKSIRAGESGNNLSGFYFGLKGEIDFWSVRPGGSIYDLETITLNRSSRIKGRNANALFTTGWQQQFSKNGYIQFSLGTGKTWQNKDVYLLQYDKNGALLPLPSKNNWIIDYRVTFGYAFGNKKPYSENDCTILQYFEKEQFMVKIDLLNFISSISKDFIIGKASLEFEQKLGRFPFSINTQAGASFLKGIGERLKGNSPLFVGTEFRHYYNLNKRIQKGKTGNNLCADYVGIGMTYLLPYSLKERTLNEGSLGSYFKWGMQRRIFKKMYFDFSIGYALSSSSAGGISEFGLDNISSNLKLGVAF